MGTRLYSTSQGQAMDELDALLERLGKSGFLLHAFHVDHHGPDILAAVRNYSGLADVVMLFDENTACAFRTPTGGDIDLYNPHEVYWWYGTNPVHTLRAILTLAPPGTPRRTRHADGSAPRLRPAPRGPHTCPGPGTPLA